MNPRINPGLAKALIHDQPQKACASRRSTSGTRCASTCWRNSTAPARTATSGTCRSISTTCARRPKAAATGVSNLALSCAPCNGKKGTRDIEEFLARDPARLARVLAQLKRPLGDAAAVNATREALFRALVETGLPVEAGTGAQTKFNRSQLGLPKAHWIDAACVGDSGAGVTLNPALRPLRVKATGHGSRQMCGTDRYGFPVRHRSRERTHFGFETGDMVRADVPAGKRAGCHAGRVLCRANGSFDIHTAAGRMAGISHKHCKPLQRKDGYAYF